MHYRGSRSAEVVKPWLKSWKWDKSAEEFLKYWFGLESDIQNDVLEFIAVQRRNGVKVFLASQQEKHRGEYMKNTLRLKDKFDGFFLTFEMGLYKDDPQFFRAILDKLGTEPGSVLFIDDEQENLDAAAEAGIHTHFFTNIETLKKFFEIRFF